ncbi:DUF3710 domain-containing protein [Demequina activiva]|uniref:DUF3710 domain-containing protein n=1 Tax=Demequina activiva TaxID=1582364 RepID=A0A919Q546_9MICO|nr:DUF3710 domain-containing protein [Demequina activiva]GIG54683.1 hypothetical protein Dac01nite_14350 [Demequina activiva]
MSDDAPAPFDDGLGDIEPADGPWSLADAPAERMFISCGPLRLPAFGSMHARLEFDAKTRRMGAVSVHIADCEAQIQVIAAPRGQGLWTDMRRSITAKVKKQPGFQQTVEGRFGPELFATVTGRDRAGLLRDTTIRYVGIDGDRWVLRAVVTGPSVAEDSTIARVDAFLSQCAVERGDEAIPTGTVLELTPPAGGPARTAAPAPDLEAP